MGSSWVVAFTAADVGTPDAAYRARIDRAHELRAGGWLIEAIADEPGVCAASVHAYLPEPSPGGPGMNS